MLELWLEKNIYFSRNFFKAFYEKYFQKEDMRMIFKQMFKRVFTLLFSRKDLKCLTIRGNQAEKYEGPLSSFSYKKAISEKKKSHVFLFTYILLISMWVWLKCKKNNHLLIKKNNKHNFFFSFPPNNSYTIVKTVKEVVLPLLTSVDFKTVTVAVCDFKRCYLKAISFFLLQAHYGSNHEAGRRKETRGKITFDKEIKMNSVSCNR